MALAKTVPFASVAMQVGGSVESTSSTGPARSLGVSAETQLVSSALSSSFAEAEAETVSVVVVDVEGLGREDGSG